MEFRRMCCCGLVPCALIEAGGAYLVSCQVSTVRFCIGVLVRVDRPARSGKGRCVHLSLGVGGC